MKKYIITITSDGVSKFGSDGKIDRKNKPTFEVFTKIENVIDGDTAYRDGIIPNNIGGYIFEYNGEKYWTWRRWLLAEHTEENIELIKSLEEVRNQQKLILNEIESISEKIKFIE